jgi:hypothetical protein
MRSWFARLGAIAALAVSMVVASTAGVGCGGDGTPLATPSAIFVQETATSAPDATATAAPPPTATPIVVGALPVIDLHFHPEAAWGEGLIALFDDLGVRAAGSGAQMPDAEAIALADGYRGRVVVFGGGFPLRQFVLGRGAAAWNLEDAEVAAYLDRLETEVAAGRFAGMGEIHVDSTASYFTGTPPIRFPADAPLMQRLWSMSAEYGLPLQIHMDGSAESVAGMERLIASDRRGTLLWAHTGHYAEPELVRRLLREHPNLYCELSYRSSISPSRTAIALDNNGVLREEWRALIEEFPDRFVVGTDLSVASPAEYTRHIGFWRAIFEQLSPETAVLVAHGNAEGLLDLGG